MIIKEWFNIKIHSEKKLAENAASPKELRQTSKLPRLSNNKTPPLNICLKNKNDLSFVSFSIETFKKESLSLAENLVLNLPKRSNNFRIESVDN